MNLNFESLLEMEFAPLAEVKAKLSEMVRRTQGGKRVIITSHGHPSAVLMAFEDFKKLLRGTEKRAADLPPIDFQDWKKQKGQRKKVTASILGKFNPKTLPRKGQKKYKRDALRGFTKGN